MDLSALVSLCLLSLLLCEVRTVSAQRQCPKLQKPWNGQIVGACERDVGAQCVFECRDPYNLVGSRVRVCQENGTWSGQTSACELNYGCNDNCGGCVNNCGGCIPNNCGSTTCPATFPPENGYVEGQCNPGIVGQSCFVLCNGGYAVSGANSRLTCLPSGQWSSYPPYCRRTSGAICNTFSILNGDTECVIEGGLTICSVTCNPGYMLVGSSVITCSSSGTWNEQLPFCRRGTPEVTNICPTLNAPEGGRLVGSCTAANSGDTCQLVCISGYRPSDTRVLICQTNGQWSSTLPRCLCKTNGCPDIQVPNAALTGTCSPGVSGQSCTVTCQAGYTLTGTATLICQTNGQWSGNIPTCSVRSCPGLQPPVSGTTSGSCNPGVIGQTCSFYCNAGFNLVGQSNLVCGNNGQWSGNPPQCVAPTGCPDLNPPAFGGLSGQCRQATVGQSCTFTCQAGYTLTGQATLFCQAGGYWSSAAPTCSRVTPATCASLIAPNGGYMLGTCAPGRVGETCVFGCDEGFVLRGDRTLTCEGGGQWSRNPPYCQRHETERGTCPILTPPPHGVFEECDNNAGGRCVVVCEQGYLRTGSRVRTCLTSGVWTGYAPTCTRKVGYTTTYTYKVVPLWSLVFG